MTQPRYEFWRTITPVLGEPIPHRAQYESGEPGERQWLFFGMARQQHFAASHLNVSWQVPVEVIPLDVAVEAIASNAEYHNNIESWVVDVDGTRCYGGNLVALDDSIAEALRKAAK